MKQNDWTRMAAKITTDTSTVCSYSYFGWTQYRALSRALNAILVMEKKRLRKLVITRKYVRNRNSWNWVIYCI